MSILMATWLPTLLGAVVFMGFSLAALALFAALATNIEDRFLTCEDTEADGITRAAA